MNENDITELENIANSLKRMNAKVKLFSIIRKAKKEYDKYDYNSGIETLKKGLDIDKTNPTVLRGLGCMNQFQGNYEKAIEYFNKALENSEAKEVEYTLIGMVYYIQNNLDESIKYFNLALEENDNYDSAYEGRNQAMLENHVNILDLQEALKKYF